MYNKKTCTHESIQFLVVGTIYNTIGRRGVSFDPGKALLVILQHYSFGEFPLATLWIVSLLRQPPHFYGPYIFELIIHIGIKYFVNFSREGRWTISPEQSVHGTVLWFPGTLRGTTLTTSSTIRVEHNKNLLPLNLLKLAVLSTYSVVAARAFQWSGISEM